MVPAARDALQRQAGSTPTPSAEPRRLRPDRLRTRRIPVGIHSRTISRASAAEPGAPPKQDTDCTRSTPSPSAESQQLSQDRLRARRAPVGICPHAISRASAAAPRLPPSRCLPVAIHSQALPASTPATKSEEQALQESWPPLSAPLLRSSGELPKWTPATKSDDPALHEGRQPSLCAPLTRSS